MRQFVEDMKQRPKEDRMAFAVWASVGAVVVLGVVWVFFLLQTIKENTPVIESPAQPPLFEES